ncbi:MAG: hypothetical protein AB8F95_14200 [Bacteroidia bacterium]
MIRKFLFWALLVTAFASTGLAQTITLSPYSRYGVGDFFQNTTTRNMAMGDLGVATTHYSSINRLNPASYADLLYSTLDVSGFAQMSRLRDANATEQQFTAGFQNVAYGFPSNTGPVIVFGFAPYTGVGYNVSRTDSLVGSEETLVYQRSYTGEGGINQAFLGLGFNALKRRLKIGVNGYYNFGSLRYTGEVAFGNSNLGNLAPIGYEETVYLSGPGFQVGAIFTDTLSGKRKGKPAKGRRAPITMLRLGATMDYSAGLNGDRVRRFSTLYIDAGDTLPGVSGDDVEQGRSDIPPKFGFGASIIRPGSWELSAEANFQDLTKFTFFDVSGGLQSGMRLALGGEWIPKIDGKSYFQRIAYRGGLYYDRGYLQVADQTVSDRGFSFGFGLPASRKGTSLFNRERAYSRINLGFAVGQRGSISSGLPLDEFYVRARVGVTISERWFRRYRVD